MRILQSEDLKKYNCLYRKVDDFYHFIALQSGLSDSAFWSLYTICEYGDGCLQRDICKLSSISKQTVHSSIRKLEQEGYLYLKSGKGRDKQIFLTEAGERLVEEKIAPVIRMENAALEEMGERERDEMLRLTEKYITILQTRFNQIER